MRHRKKSPERKLRQLERRMDREQALKDAKWVTQYEDQKKAKKVFEVARQTKTRKRSKTQDAIVAPENQRRGPSGRTKLGKSVIKHAPNFLAEQHAQGKLREYIHTVNVATALIGERGFVRFYDC